MGVIGRGMDKLTTALDEISDELHHQYSLGSLPREPELGWKIPEKPDRYPGEVEIELRIARLIAKQSFDNQVTTVLIRIPIL